MNLENLVVAMPSGDAHGWGICGNYLSKGLQERGAKIFKPVSRVGFEGYGGSAVLQAISGHDFNYTSPVVGATQIGYGFIESNLLAEKYLPLAERLWDKIVPGSNWMKEWLESKVTDIKVAKPVIQGIDPQLFYLGEHSLADPQYFTVGSFGKFEFRKGQDIVIKAMSIFCERHKDARLLYAWKNDWPQTIRDMAYFGQGLVEVPFYAHDEPYRDGTVFRALLNKYKIPFVEVPLGAKYHQISEFYSECDVALFPARAEAGQALPFQECLAVGVPAIAPWAHGMKDITAHPDYPCKDLTLFGGKQFIHEQNGLPLGDWTEGCISEILSHLEYSYLMRDNLKSRRKQIADFGARFTWKSTVDSMISAIQ